MQIRIRWFSEIAASRHEGRKLAPGVLQLAGYIMERSIDGRVLVPTGTIAATLGVNSKTIARAFDVLVALGFLVLTKRHTQHHAPIYSMARLPTDVRSDVPRPPKRGRSGRRQTPHRCPPDSPPLSARVDTAGDQQGEYQGGEQGEGDVLVALRSAGAHLKCQGRDISSEWSEIVGSFGLPAVRGALAKLAPKDKWPSRVRERLELAQELPGLAERQASADDIRDALGVPAGGADG